VNKSVRSSGIAFLIVASVVMSAGCRSATNLVGLTDPPSRVDLDTRISKASEAYNPYTFDNDKAREWVEKAWALCSRIYTPGSADSVEARFRVLRDSDNTSNGEDRKDLIIDEEEAETGFRKTFARYADALGDHPFESKTFLKRVNPDADVDDSVKK
jgi:hypothetical protein